MAASSQPKQMPARAPLIFLALAGILFVIQVGELNLSSYVQNYKHAPGGASASAPGLRKKKRYKVSDRDVDAILSRVHGNLLERESTERSDPESPACHPHFRAAVPSKDNTTWAWSDDDSAKFRRLYFYHNRKAGGTSLAEYFKRVANHHGLEYVHMEWKEAEEPGTQDVPTFYVSHLREPVDRSISHFKYQGRWNCRDLMKMRMRRKKKGNPGDEFVPTEENAQKLETWTETGGHEPTICERRAFSLGTCAVNCYTQWFSGLSCPRDNKSTAEQLEVARERLLRYNFVVSLERLRDPAYAQAVEDFFGVEGVTKKRGAFCERTSHEANKRVPLVIRNETVKRLTDLNEADIGLYKEVTGCLNIDGSDYGFPRWDSSRFANVSVKVPYYEYDEMLKEQRAKKQDDADDEDKIDISLASTDDDEVSEER